MTEGGTEGAVHPKGGQKDVGLKDKLTHRQRMRLRQSSTSRSKTSGSLRGNSVSGFCKIDSFSKNKRNPLLMFSHSCLQ